MEAVLLKLTRRGRLTRSLVVLVAPLVVFFLIGAVTGSEDLGSAELTICYAVWAVGLGYVWWPRRDRHPK